MKRAVTAIGNEEIHNRLKEEKNYEIVGKDIQYQEGIFEFLEQKIEIDYLIISDFLQGDFSIEELIEKIKKRKKDLKIILIYSMENQKKNQLIINNKIEEAINYEKIIKKNFIEPSNNIEEEDLKKEIETLREEIKKIKKEKRRCAIVLVFFGDHCAGKTSICFMMAHMLINQKILMIDFDYERKSLLKITRKELKEEVERKINKRITICDGEKIIQNYESMIEKFKQKYDFILIDTNTEDTLQINNELSKISDLNVFVIESSYSGNLRGIEFFVKNQAKIEWKKTKILFNRFSKQSLTISTLIRNFREFPILGTVRETKNYARNMNFRYRKHYGGIQEWKDYKEIIKRIKFPEKMTERAWISKLRHI